MKPITAAEARRRLFALLEGTAQRDRAYRITHADGEAVLVSRERYESLLETLELLSSPGLAKSIRKARQEIACGETYSLEEVLGAG